MAHLQEHLSLRPFHTFNLSVSARWMIEIRTEKEAVEFLADNRFAHVDMLILGGGSNVLFTRDFQGIVLRNCIHGIEVVEEHEDSVLLKVGAGETWHQFVLYCLEQNYFGIENLSLIPGTVGAAPIQNIGAYGVEVKEVIESVETIHLTSFEPRTFSRDECQFGYRDSIFKRQAKGKYLITRVNMRLSKVPAPNLRYGAIASEVPDPATATPKEVSDAVIRIRQSKLPDPAEIGNAGSFFKNPEIPVSLFEQIKAEYPEVPSYPISEEIVKVPAGWLIQTAGWKGKRIGDYGVHARQALVLVNYGDASGADIYQLSEKILQDIREKFGISLEREVQVIGAVS